MLGLLLFKCLNSLKQVYKSIKIGRREYKLLSSALSIILYETHFNSNIYEDMEKALTILKMLENKKTFTQEEIQEFNQLKEVITRMAWIMAYCYDNKIEDYIKFKNKTKNYKWLGEVLEHFASSFQDGKERETQETNQTKLENNELIAISKKYGFSFGELNQIKYIDLINILNVYVDKTEKTRQATQEDFDSF